MRFQNIAAVLNGSLALAMYEAAWGSPTWTIAGLEIALAFAAAVSTWWALKRTIPQIALG